MRMLLLRFSRTPSCSNSATRPLADHMSPWGPSILFYGVCIRCCVRFELKGQPFSLMSHNVLQARASTISRKRQKLGQLERQTKPGQGSWIQWNLDFEHIQWSSIMCGNHSEGAMRTPPQCDVALGQVSQFFRLERNRSRMLSPCSVTGSLCCAIRMLMDT